MEDHTMTTKKALSVVGVLVFLIALTLVIPANWVGVKVAKRKSLILKNPNELALLSEDSDRNSNPDWQDLLLENVTPATREAADKMTVTDETRSRLLDPNNLTASFSKNIYTTSEYVKKNGTLTGSQQSELVSTLLNEEAKKIQVKVYGVEDITISPNDDEESKKKYGNALGLILQKANQYKLGSSDIAILQAYSTNKDPAPLASLRIKKNNLDLIITDLLKTPVPHSAVPYHLLVINRLSELKTTIDNLSQADTDPVRASIAFKSYLPISTSLAASLASLQMYFEIENITFTKNEPGAAILPGYTTQ